MIKFGAVRFKNFLSTGNQFTEIQLNRPGKTLVIGRNGNGKSQFVDAIAFALYGRAFRDVNKQGLVNSVNKRDCLVEIDFSIGNDQYMVVRGQKPHRFEIYKNDDLINQDAGARDYQKHLEENILKMNYRTFRQIVILGSASFTPFMQLKAWERREIVEDLLDIKLFSLMNTLLKERVTENRTKHQSVTHELKLAEAELKFQQQLNSQNKETKQTLIETKKTHVTVIEASIRKEDDYRIILTNEKEALGFDWKNLDSINSELMRLNSVMDRMQDRYRREELAKEFYTNNSVCDHCHQNINQEFKKATIDKINTSINELGTAINSLMRKQDGLKLRIAECKRIAEQIKDIDLKIARSGANKEAFKKQLRQANEEIKKAEDELHLNQQDNSATILELQTLTKWLNASLAQLEADGRILSIAGGLLKDGGIKTRVIRQYIPVMNKLINKYLSLLDFFVQFELDEEFKETIKSRHRDEFSYANFSEGEKTRINVAILFAWRAIAKMRNCASTNLLIMDEILDGSLDNIGVEEFLKLMDENGTEQSLFVISHRGETLIEKFDHTIKFNKQGNYSVIED